MCPTGWAVPTDQGAQYQRDQVNPHVPASASCAHARSTAALEHDAGRPHPRPPRPHRRSVSPDRIGATLGDEARTFGELDTGANRAAHRLAAEGVAAGRPGHLVGPHGVRRARGRATAPASSAPPSRRSTPTSPSPRRRRRSRCCARGSWSPPRRTRTLARAVAEPLGLAVLVTAPGWHARRVDRRASRASGRSEDPSIVFLTSGSTGVSKGAVLSHRAAWLRAIQRDDEDGATGRRGSVVMFGLFHMAGWYFIENALAADRPVHLVRRPIRTSSSHAVERWRAERPLLHPRGVAAHPRRRRHLRHLVVGRGADRDVARVARPDRRDEGALPRFVDVGRVRLDRDRAAALVLARLRPLRPAAAAWASRRRWSSPTSPTTASCGCAAPPCSRATSTGPTPPPRRSTTTAGSTPATS